ncbi:unnamed protein product, partial [Cyprideis torosa]
MAGYEWKGVRPFKDVYFTGMVRDKQRRKMSKSLGNSPDALKLIEQYGADSVRFGMMSCSPAGGDLLFDEKLIVNGRNFCNKIWNALNLVKSWEADTSVAQKDYEKLAIRTMEHRIQACVTDLEQMFGQYRLSEALMRLYSLIWNDFFQGYLEMVKNKDKKYHPDTLEATIALYEKLCILLHPFMPFITEEIWQNLRDRQEGDDLIVAAYPRVQEHDTTLLKHMSLFDTIVTKVRDIKQNNNVSRTEKVDMTFVKNDEIDAAMQVVGFEDLLSKMAIIENVDLAEDQTLEGVAAIAGKTKFYVHVELAHDPEELLKDLEEQLAHQKRFVLGSDEYLTVATTRPETLLGDTAVAVHPDDERYAHLVDAKVIVPLVNRVVPLIKDDYVDMEFGTGALKVTPAHDPNDFEIGQRHGLETIDVFTPDAKVSEAGQLFVGMDRFDARKAIVIKLKEEDLHIETKPHLHNVGRSERTNAVIEPRLSLQWYVDMKQVVQPAIDGVNQGDITFHPENYINTYNHWLNNIRDWCISRQLWWGHRIPAWYYEEDVFVAATEEEALKLARQKHGDSISLDDLRQDEDVLDTWFSSWLWPFSVFAEEPEALDYYYPTSIL